MKLRILIILTICVIILGFLGFYFFNNYNLNAISNYAFKTCTQEAKLCSDGSAVGRDPNNNCEFFQCPGLEYCDTNNQCSSGNCYLFPDSEKAYCYNGNPCTKCDSGNCDLLKSDPVKIVCV